MEKRIFIFILDSISLAEKNYLKKEYRKINVDIECRYYDFSLLKVDEVQKYSDDITICIDFKREYFVEIVKWIQKLRSVNFNGTILLSMDKQGFDYNISLKFLAIGGSYILDRKAWLEKPSMLINPTNDESVDAWIYNKLSVKRVAVDNDDVIDSLYNEILLHQNLKLNTLKYVYSALEISRKDEFLSLIKSHFKKKPFDIYSTKGLKKISNGLIVIWDNAEFCCELASVIASRNKKTVVVDLDRLNPTFDFQFPAKKRQTMNLSDVQRFYSSKELNKDNVLKFCYPTKIKNLKVLYGLDDIKKFEYFTNEALIELLNILLIENEFVIVNVNKFIYDAYTCLSVIKADKVLVPIDNNIVKIREKDRLLRFICEKQKIDVNKIGYVFFESDKKIALLSEMLNGNIIGQISFCKKRLNYRNIKKSYSRNMTRSIKKQYMLLVDRIISD